MRVFVHFDGKVAKKIRKVKGSDRYLVTVYEGGSQSYSFYLYGTEDLNGYLPFLRGSGYVQL